MKRAVWFVALAIFAQDPAGTLEKARENILPKLARLPKVVCVETIDRRYYPRRDATSPAPSCETIAIDRKKGRNPPKLGYADRVRVAVAFTGDREVYSWTGREPASYSVEDILHPGPIGTGAFAGHLLDIFTNPAVQFKVLEERPDALQYGYRVPVDASHYLIGAGAQWVATGYDGSFEIQTASRNIGRFTLQTSELPPETSMCETSSALEFADGAAWFVPRTGTAHDVMRDGTESDSVTTISDCQEAKAESPPRASSVGSPLAANILLSLVFQAPFDSDATAAGDTISATITEAHTEGSKDGKFGYLVGATVRGRIARVEHRPTIFLFAVAFDTLDVKGVVSPFYGKLIHPPLALSPSAEKSTRPPPIGHGRSDWSGTFIFDSRAAHFVWRAPFESKWVTTAP